MLRKSLRTNLPLKHWWWNESPDVKHPPLFSQFNKEQPTPILKFPSNFADEKHLFLSAGEALKHWYKHILHHYANTCRDHRENIQHPGRRGGRAGAKRKTGTSDLRFYFHDLPHKRSLALAVIPRGKPPFQHKRATKEAEEGNSNLKSTNSAGLVMLYHIL